MQSTPENEIANRVIVLGASNVTIGLPTVVRLIHSGFDGPLQIDIADGHGRSYGIESSMLFRRLPGHTMHPFPTAKPSRQISAVLTDIGNDLLYGVSVPQIVEWVRDRAEKLCELGAHIVMTQLPVESIRSLSKSKYVVFRTLFFPGSRVPFGELQDATEQLNESVREVATAVNATLVAPQAAWYGLDPIHIRRSARRQAWAEIMRGWHDWSEPNTLKQCDVGSVRLWRSKSQRRTVWGKPQSHDRTISLDSGTTVRFF